MKFWLLTTEYPPFFGGGISTYCYHTCCMLTRKGHQVTVFVNDDKVKSVEVTNAPEARLVRFNSNITNASSFLGNITKLSYSFAAIVKQFIEKENAPHVIEAQDYNGIAFFLLQHKACLADWCRDIPVVLTLHSPSFLYQEYNDVSLYKRPNYWIGEMERFCIQAADLVISPSQYLIEELKERFKIFNSKLYVIPNPYFFNSDEQYKLSIAASAKHFTIYGKLSAQKGTFRILSEFEKLWNKGQQNELVMIGGDDIVYEPMGKTMGKIVRKKYKKYIEKHLLKLRNRIPPSERAKVLKDSIFFIVPSIVDNLPYTVMELMSLGKIIIVSKQGGQAEIVTDGIDGFTFDYQLSGSFEEVLNKVKKLGKEELLTIAQHAITKIETNYAYDRIYNSKIQKIEETIKQYAIPAKFPFVRKVNVPEKEIPVKEGIPALLSVVIPYYNLGKYIDETVQSVLNASYPHLEILIINDGSTDSASIKMLEKYKTNDRITIINKANSGLAEARNTGAENARGEFLAFLDADDTVAPEYYEKAIRILKQYDNVHFVGAWTRYMDGSQNIWPTFNPEPPLLLTHNMINSSALVYKTAFFKAYGKNDKAFKIGLEDYESVIRLKSNGANGVAIPELLFNYRVRKNSMIKSVNQEVRAEYYQKIKEKHSDLFHEFKEVNLLNKENDRPLSFDNSTLDNFPLQGVPVIGRLFFKMIIFVKSTPELKNTALLIKRIMGLK